VAPGRAGGAVRILWVAQCHPNALVRLQAEISRSLADTSLKRFRQAQLGDGDRPQDRAVVTASGAEGIHAMIGRPAMLAIGLVTGLVLAWGLPELSHLLPETAFSSGTPSPEKSAVGAGSSEHQPGTARLSAEAIEAAGINLATVQSGTIAHKIIVPGAIVPEADRIAHVAVKLSSIVAELRKNTGDSVEKNEVVAVLESREVADAKSEYLAARLTSELQKDLLERDKALFDKQVSSEQQFIRSRNEAARAVIRIDIARQKLFALGLTETEIAGLPNQPEALLRLQEVRSPISGRVVERKVELGVAVGRDNLETELFVIADLDRVWVELAVSPEDVSRVRIGQTVSVTARGTAEAAKGKLIFIGPILDKDTRSARVVAEINNNDGVWRPGLFVTAAIVVEERSAAVAVPVAAIQTMDGRPVAFIRTSDGFQKRQVVLGERDERAAEVASGLSVGETIAVTHTFLLKAEMLKGADED
jgi:membrane fusion protein, heavy metal efflux system